MTYLDSFIPFSFFSIFSIFLLINFLFFYLFSNALGLLAYIYLNNIIFKERVFFGETILIDFKINSLEITVS